MATQLVSSKMIVSLRRGDAIGNKHSNNDNARLANPFQEAGTRAGHTVFTM